MTTYEDEKQEIEFDEFALKEAPSDTAGSGDRNDPNYLLRLRYTREEEKKLVRKLDIHVVLFVSALYLVSFLDRSNIGNANTAGMSTDLGMTNSQYQWLLTIFYIAYISGQNLTLLWKLLPPSRYVMFVVCGWGIVSTCQAASNSWGGMMALRLLLGLFEAGFGPGVPYYLTYFFYRHEVTYRISYFMCVPSIASAFAGALAYGITYHKHAIESWRILYIVEGVPTFLMGILCWWFIPNSPSDVRALTEREKDIAAARVLRQLGTTKKSNKLHLSDVVNAITDFKTICSMILFFCVNVAFSALPIYLPTLIHDMGYTSVNAQGMSAPPYIAAFFFTLGGTWLTHKFKQRGYVLSFFYLLTAVGYIILINVETHGVRYLGTFIACCGTYPIVPILLSWNLQGTDGERGFSYVMMSIVGQCGPILGTRIFPSSEGPMYKKGGWISIGCMLLGSVVSLVLRTHLARKNSQLDEKYGKPKFTQEQLIELQTRGDASTLPEGTVIRDEEDNIAEEIKKNAAGLEGNNNIHFRYAV